MTPPHESPRELNQTLELPLSRSVKNVIVLTKRRFLADLFARAIAEAIDPERFAPSRLLVVDGQLRPDDPEVSERIAQARTSGSSVIAICTPPSPLAAASWVEVGASAVLTDDASFGDLVDVIERFARGEVVMGVAIREGLLSQLRASRQQQADREALFLSLTRREREVLELLAQGACPEDVAKASFVSLNTVRTQIRGVLAKLNVSSVVAAVALAYRSGWIEDRRQGANHRW